MLNPFPAQDILILPDEHGNPPIDALATHKPATWPVYVLWMAPRVLSGHVTSESLDHVTTSMRRKYDS